MAELAGSIWKLEGMYAAGSAGGVTRAEKILEAPVDYADFERLITGASHVKLHPDAAGTRGGNPAADHAKKARAKMHLAAWCAGAILYHFRRIADYALAA